MFSYKPLSLARECEPYTAACDNQASTGSANRAVLQCMLPRVLRTGYSLVTALRALLYHSYAAHAPPSRVSPGVVRR